MQLIIPHLKALSYTAFVSVRMKPNSHYPWQCKNEKDQDCPVLLHPISVSQQEIVQWCTDQAAEASSQEQEDGYIQLYSNY